jgi:hypothetical protein
MSIQRLLDFFNSFIPTSASTDNAPSFYRSIYPESVRYALRYNEAQMGKPELFALITDWSFEVVYLLTKALIVNREHQRRFLEDLTALYIQDDWQMSALHRLLTDYIQLLPDDATVKGTKLAQISRSGVDNWHNEWRGVIQEALDDRPNALPCLIAHTPIYAYHHFVAAYKDSPKKKLLLLMPDWIIDPDEGQMGYEVILTATPTVAFQVKRECLYGSWKCDGLECRLKQHFCEDAIFIDDTINTARTAGKLQSFWLTRYGLNMPLSRVFAITNLRQTQHNHEFSEEMD